WIILQLVLVAGVALWAVGRRLGPAVPAPVTEQADAVAYASSVARIYEKADLRPRVGEGLARAFLDALTRHLGLRRNAGAGDILAAWRQGHGEEASRRLGELLQAAERLARGEAPGADALLALAQRFDAFLRDYVRKPKRAHGAALHG